LAGEIDKLTGPRGRSAFLVESAEKEVRRLKLMAYLDDSTPAWKPEDHSGVREAGTAAYVRNQRQRRSNRQLMIESWAEERNS
jgi:hypothetical protein